MIIEIAKFEVQPGYVDAFTKAAQIGGDIFSKAEGCVAMELRPCVENPGSYRMIVLWRTLEDHIEKFRNSQGVQEWRAAIGPFLKEPAEILNFAEPIVRSGKSL
jgi:quinol monooxygenase YgiN